MFYSAMIIITKGIWNYSKKKTSKQRDPPQSRAFSGQSQKLPLHNKLYKL